MRARALFLAAAVFTGGATAYAQPREDNEPGAVPPTPEGTSTSSGWRTYPRERHLLVRLEATGAARLTDPLNQGAIGPVSGFVQGSFAFLNVGGFLLGPSVGFQLAGDQSGLQYAIQPGVTAYRRFSGLFGLTARVDVPILITRGLCDEQPPRVVPESNRLPGERANPANWSGYGAGPGYLVPTPEVGFCGTTAVGIEAAVGAAIYLRSGVALTGEVMFDMYFGNRPLTFPMLGAGLGLLFDYEVLP